MGRGKAEAKANNSREGCCGGGGGRSGKSIFGGKETLLTISHIRLISNEVIDIFNKQSSAFAISCQSRVRLLQGFRREENCR